MRIHIQGLHTTLTPAIEEYTQKRIGSLAKFIKHEGALCNIELIKTTEHHRSGEIFKAEAIIHMGDGAEVYAVAEKEDLYQAVDALRDDLERTLTSMKEKKITLFRRGAAQIKNLMKNIRPWKRK